jgi:putative ABC transport system permease protein
MTNLLADLRFFRRRFTRRPAVITTAIVALALGMSATTAMFSVVDAVLLERLPWSRTDPTSVLRV